jgi:5'-3' exonuclease
MQLPASYFSGKRVVIDGDNLSRRFMSTAHKDVVNETDVTMEPLDRIKIRTKWLLRWKEFLNTFLYRNITPIIVLDGTYPIAKKKTQEERRNKRRKLQEEVNSILEQMSNLDILERDKLMMSDLRKKMAELHYISTEDKEIFIQVITSVGIPFLQAVGEGEKLCSMLAREGKVDAIYSKDTDALVYGSPLVITEFGKYAYNPETKRSEEYFLCTRFDGLLDGLGLSYQTFVDLCIMAGCDYNDNIKQLGIGRAYTLLKQCQSIDSIPPKYNSRKHVLNTETCREMFKIVPSSELCQNEMKLYINTDLSNSRDILDMYNLGEWLNYLVGIYSNFTHPLNLTYPSPKIKLQLICNNQPINPIIPATTSSLNQSTIKNLNSIQFQNLASTYDFNHKIKETLESTTFL